MYKASDDDYDDNKYILEELFTETVAKSEAFDPHDFIVTQYAPPRLIGMPQAARKVISPHWGKHNSNQSIISVKNFPYLLELCSTVCCTYNRDTKF